jgi:hypothetical protein
MGAVAGAGRPARKIQRRDAEHAEQAESIRMCFARSTGFSFSAPLRLCVESYLLTYEPK